MSAVQQMLAVQAGMKHTYTQKAAKTESVQVLQVYTGWQEPTRDSSELINPMTTNKILDEDIL
eukprot:scaffold70534_cov17-Tisochrysis_lutea.AAC.1